MLSLVTATAFVGFLDDLLGSRVIGGLRGHFSQIRFGIVTTGALKAFLGVSIATIVSAAISDTALLFLLNLGVLTLSINITNLFDLRPGRAIKVFALSSLAVFIAGFTAPSAGTASFWRLWGFIIPPVLGLLWGDLKQRSMMGDAGSNALGAILGLAFVINLSWLANLVILGVLIALHLVSEKYSISTFIEKTPIIKQLDELGWKR
jgi:UDP-N-acetylmuramyl pentapeptide phosphotransferase/UDP-N-acetylglucosamine-1-phosphate transferase